MQKALVYFLAVTGYCLLPHAEAQSYQSPGKKKIDSLEHVIAITGEDTAKIAKLNALAQQYILSSTVGSEAWNSRDLKSRPH